MNCTAKLVYLKGECKRLATYLRKPIFNSMTKIKIGIIQERKSPPDFRVPLTPAQCKQVMEQFPQIEISVETSPHRCFADSEYTQQGILVSDNVSDCDFLFGVKEVPAASLIPNKKYFFFSHTLKKQPYNAKLLATILEKKISLIDYEALKGADGKRIIGFGRYAGIVGVYEGVRTFGLKHNRFNMPSPITLSGREEFDAILKSANLTNVRAVLTGWGRVGNGAQEMMDIINLKRVAPQEFLDNPSEGGVYTHIDTPEMYKRIDGTPFNKSDFYANPNLYTSALGEYVQHADIYFACHLWNAKNPILLDQSFFQQHSRCKVVADVSCDLNGPIACTIKASKVSDSVFGYGPATGAEVDFRNENAVAVMSIDNLPCELPKDASEDFGNEIMKSILPALLNFDADGILWKGTETTTQGELTPHFEYLKDYVAIAR